MKTPTETTPLTRSDLERFHRLAPKVLQARGQGYCLAGLHTSFQFFLAGGLPIIGVAFLGWSASNWLLFFLVGCWVGLLTDCGRLHFLRREVQAYCERVVDQTFVSVVSEALRTNKTEVAAAHVPKMPNYRTGILIDLVFGTISTMVIIAMMPEELSGEVLGRQWFLPLLVGFVLHRIAMTVWEIADHRRDPHKEPVVKLALGLRGASMFIVMFVVVFLFDEAQDRQRAARSVVYGVNALLVAIGVLNLVGVFSMIGETRWLRKYLSDTAPQREERSADRT